VKVLVERPDRVSRDVDVLPRVKGCVGVRELEMQRGDLILWTHLFYPPVRPSRRVD
jgi:hypothetical protein